MQMIERPGRRDPEERFGLLPNPSQVPPVDFRSGEAIALLAGAQDLLALCVSLIDFGFRVIDFSFRDRYFTVVDNEVDGLSMQLEDLIHGKDLEGAVRTLFGLDIFVERVRLRNDSNGHVVTIQTDGVIDGARPDDQAPLVSAMQKAFRER
jgi:hypothetical protein